MLDKLDTRSMLHNSFRSTTQGSVQVTQSHVFLSCGDKPYLSFQNVFNNLFLPNLTFIIFHDFKL